MKFSRCLCLCTILFSTFSIFAQSETEKGVEFYRNGDFDGAISVLQKVVETDKKDRKARHYLGASFVKKGRDKEAREAFQTTQGIFIPREVAPPDLEKIRIISKSYPSSEGVEKKDKINGSVLFAIEFKANGELGFIFPVKNTLSDSLTKNAIKAAQKIKFEPAQKNGKPISIIKFIEYHYTFF